MNKSLLSLLSLFLLLSISLFASSQYYEYGKKIELTPYSPSKSQQLNLQNNNHNLRYYKNKDNRVVGVADTIIAKCFNKNSCEVIIKKYTNLAYKIISKDTYLITLENADDIFNMSVILYEEGCFKYVHPNFYRQRELR